MQTHSSKTSQLMQASQRLYEEGRYREVLGALMEGFAHDPDHRPYYELAGQALDALMGAREARLFRQALDNFGQYEPFYKLGSHFVAAWHYEMAIPFLEKALRMAPQAPQVAYELSTAYTNTLRLHDAFMMLRKLDKHDFWTLYALHRIDFLLNGPMPELYSYLVNSKKGLYKHESSHAPALQAIDELAYMKTRYLSLSQPQAHVRDWHFIQYGASVLHFSDLPDGRYGSIQGSMQHIREVLGVLVTYLETLQQLPKTVFYLQNTDSQVLGMALALLIGVPAKPIGQVPQSHALLVSADAAGFNQHCTELWHVAQKQSVFAFYTCWSHPCAVVPDISGMLCHEYDFPWQEALPDQEIAATAQQLASMPLAPASMAAFRPTLNFFKQHKELLAQQYTGIRQSFWVESPVMPAT